MVCSKYPLPDAETLLATISSLAAAATKAFHSGTEGVKPLSRSAGVLKLLK